MDIQTLLTRNREGAAVGLPSFCSANRHVLDAAFAFAAANDFPIVIEATCNQVNQHGGYTGLTPAQFATKVRAMAAAAGLALDNLILGGDHLGPNPWRSQPAAEAMSCARELVASYAAAGFEKIHLDASMACAGEPTPSFPEVARRAAELCRVAEDHAPDPERLFYVVGTEVPVPGGETEGMDQLQITSPERLDETVATHREAFLRGGLEKAFTRVVSVVVQPGVDFSHTKVHDYDHKKAARLSKSILAHPGMTFEAHSTDYQTTQALGELVADHFLFLKVGPELTFAFREAVFALEAIERTLVEGDRSYLTRTVLDAMAHDTKDWQAYYQGSTRDQDYLKIYSYSDRIRYYWDRPAVKAALENLIANLRGIDIPAGLISQHLGVAPYDQHRGEGVEELLHGRINLTVARYFRACGFES